MVGSMISLVFLCALCFGTTVEALQTITHSDHLDVMHKPLFICILAGIDCLVWCLVYRWIGGYTFHQRTAIESEWLKRNPHYPCLNSLESEQVQLTELQNASIEMTDGGHENSDLTEGNTSSVTKDGESTDIVAKIKLYFQDPRREPLNLCRDLTPSFILIVTCLAVYLIDESVHPNAAKYMDPAMALFTIAFLVISSIPIVKKTCLILLQ